MSLLLLFFQIFLLVNAKLYKSNVTDFSQCKIYYSRSGSVYKDFFEIEDHPSNGSLLDFHFSVMSPSDAHILLSPSSTIDIGDPVYEIVIGAGGNTFCDIRRMRKSAVKATVRIKGLLNALDLQSFWIHMSKDGVIEVGKEGEELGFLSWTDPDPLPLKFFSFSTWPGVEAKWYYDCPREDNTTANSTELQRPLTSLERLRRDLLFYYDPYVRPVHNVSNTTVVTLLLSTNLVSLDEYKSTFHYSGSVTLSWKDQKLIWNSTNYDGINTLHIFRREIWVPDLFLFNAAYNGNQILEDTMLSVNSSGFVNWITTINMDSWCDPDDLGRWPRDEHCCIIILSFLRDLKNLQLLFNANDSNFDCPYSSRWRITEVESYSNQGWKNSTARSNFDPPLLTLHLHLQRTSNSYNVILFSPFGVVAVSLLVTFWTSPFGKMKMYLLSFQMVLTTLVLITLGIIVPVHSQLVPNLVLLYSYSFVGLVVAVIFEIVVINLSRNHHNAAVPHYLSKIIASVALKMLLCLPDVKGSERYGNLNDSKSKDQQQAMWILLGVVIDRIAFFVYLALVVYGYCACY